MLHNYYHTNIYDLQIKFEVLRQTTDRCIVHVLRVMAIAFVLLLLGGFVTASVTSCPNGYRCLWERDVFVLYCKHHFKTGAGIVADIPANATRLRVNYYNQNILAPLAFANLSNIRELTLENLKISTMGRHMFQGVEYLTSLVLRGVVLKRFDFDCFYGLTELRSLTIEHFIVLEYMDPDMLAPLISLEPLSFRHIISTKGELCYANYARVLAGIHSSNLQTLVPHDIHSKYNTETDLNIDYLFENSSIGLTLKRLDLSRNNIEYIRGSPLTTLPTLEHISLDENAFVGSRGSGQVKVLDASSCSSTPEDSLYKWDESIGSTNHK